jgi:hypothetical protein
MPLNPSDIAAKMFSRLTQPSLPTIGRVTRVSDSAHRLHGLQPACSMHLHHLYNRVAKCSILFHRKIIAYFPFSVPLPRPAQARSSASRPYARPSLTSNPRHATALRSQDRGVKAGKACDPGVRGVGANWCKPVQKTRVWIKWPEVAAGCNSLKS